MRTPYFLYYLWAILGGSLLSMSCGGAQVFTIDTNQSSVTISGTVVGGSISNQAPGSLTAKLTGSLQVELVGNTIQFSGQSLILAETNGSWQPKADGTTGSEPADFGGQANLGFASGVAALRNIQLDVISPPLPLTAAQFESTNLTFLFPSNATSALCYNVTGLVSKHGSIPMTGYATNSVTALSSLSTAGNQQSLAIPVDATFTMKVLTANDTVIRLKGQLVAVQGSQPPPLKVQSLTVQSQGVVLQWQGAPGTQFQIQSSANLGSWKTNATVVTPASGSYSWTGAITGPVQFFRLAK